jgi:hypothetical protein
MTTTIRGAICDAIKDMLTEVPPAGAAARQRASFELLKAEIYDLIAVVDAASTVQARQIANYSRYQSRLLLREARGGLLARRIG